MKNVTQPDDPIAYIAPHLVRETPQISVGAQQEYLEQFLDPYERFANVVNFAENIDHLREIIAAHEKRTSKKSTIKMIGRLCRDQTSTIFYYELEGSKERHAVGLYGHKIEDSFLEAAHDIRFVKDYQNLKDLTSQSQ
jgi:hypothetical protein|tara:strand:- start:150 stop:563 length:414 start_codon:yes stop_codon:yes gene_type:complete